MLAGYAVAFWQIASVLVEVLMASEERALLTAFVCWAMALLLRSVLAGGGFVRGFFSDVFCVIHAVCCFGFLAKHWFSWLACRRPSLVT